MAGSGEEVVRAGGCGGELCGGLRKIATQDQGELMFALDYGVRVVVCTRAGSCLFFINYDATSAFLLGSSAKRQALGMA